MPRHPYYRKSFKASPIRMGKVYRAQQRRAWCQRKARSAALFAAVVLSVFGVGMAATNWSPAKSIAQPVVGRLIGSNFAICVTDMRWNCVVDGDTFWRNGAKIRIADIDTPEVFSPNCESERALGLRATERLRELLNEGPFELQSVGDRDEDKHGRKLRVVVRNGRSLGDQLVSEGLARTWSGRREPWC